jgi:hypothetical protein
MSLIIRRLIWLVVLKSILNEQVKIGLQFYCYLIVQPLSMQKEII